MSGNDLSIDSTNKATTELAWKQPVRSCEKYATIAGAITTIGALIAAPVIGVLTLGPVAVIAGHMAMTIPFLVVTAAGGVALGYLAIQLVRHKDRLLHQWITRNEKTTETWRGRLLFRNRRPDSVSVAEAQEKNQKYRARTKKWLEVREGARATTQQITTSDGVRLDSVWCTQKNSKECPTAIIFHGQEGTLDYMYRWGNWYSRLGMNVLMVSMRGYGCSGGDPRQLGEEALVRDAKAALQFVEDQEIPKKQVIAHGYSLGGFLATTLGREGIGGVTTDHTFTDIESAAVNYARRSYLLPKSTAGMFAKTLFPAGISNLENAKKGSPLLFAIYGLKDRLMETDGSPGETASRLIDASKNMPDRNIGFSELYLGVPGGHNDFKNFFDETDRSIRDTFTEAPAGDPWKTAEASDNKNVYALHYLEHLQRVNLLPQEVSVR